jgi:glucuronosyltransferase
LTQPWRCACCTQTFRQRLANLLLHKAVGLLTMKLATTEGNRLRRELGLPPRSLQAAFSRARLLLVGTAQAFEFPRPLPPFVKLVGPLMAAPAKPLPADLEAALGGSGPRGAAFVSFGSMFVLTQEAEVRALASALASLNRTVLWRISPEQLPPGMALGELRLPARVRPVGWAPQNDVLGSPHLGVFITHAGVNSVQEAAYHGVPVVCVPFVGEQLDNAAAAEYHGFGVTVARESLAAQGDAAASELVRAVDAVARGPGYRQRAGEMQRLMRAHPRSAAAVASDWVEYALAMPAGGGMGLRDPAAELPWPAAASLDVYAVLAGAAAAAAWALWRAAAACRPRRRRTGRDKKVS